MFVSWSQVVESWLQYIAIRELKEYAHKDYLSFQKKAVGETNNLQQILWKSGSRSRRYDYLYIFQCLTMAAAILLTLSRDQIRKIVIYRIWFYSCCTWKQLKLIAFYKMNA